MPAESATAEHVGAAYLAGGKRRRALFRTSGAAEPGGFGGGFGPGELAVILDALRATSGGLLDLLAGSPLANLLVLIAVRQGMRPRTEAEPSGEKFDQVIGGLAGRLQAQGVAPERAEELTYETLKVVFQQDRSTEEIRAFLGALAASPPAERLPAERDTTAQGTGWMLPPWLWFYFLGVSAPAVPGMVASVQEDADGVASIIGYLTANANQAVAALFTGAGLMEFFPAVLLLAGIAGVLFPGTRGRWAERRHALRPSDDPAIIEMAAVVQRHAPTVELRLGGRFDRLARVYPTGWRTARIAVHPPLIRLWHADREAATAVLLHEVAHLRQGDHLIVGLASPFLWLVRVWSVLLTLLVLIPVTIYVFVGGPEAPMVLLSLVRNVATIPIALILPVAGLWVAELSADRFAIQETSPAALRRALGPVGPRTGLPARVGGLLDLLTHPPRRLRLRAAAGWPHGTAALAALWPAALVVRIVAIALFGLVAHQLNGSSATEALGEVGRGLRADLDGAQPLLVEMIVLLVNWPLLAPLWIRIWTSASMARQRFAPYLVSALVPAVLAAGSLTTGEQPPPPEAYPPTASASVSASATSPVPVPTLTGALDDRPWAGQPLPVELRVTEVIPLTQLSGPPQWLGTAAGWFGPSIWRAEADGRLSLSNPSGRTDFRTSNGNWLRQGDRVTFWLTVEYDFDGRTVVSEILGELDLTTTRLTGMWAPKITGGDPLQLLELPSFDIATAVSVDPAA
ncbi:M48 family metalloprotease [Acrocarpospora catenulata]|uniref:M48 family metalloprotease n=1 Tax=Acrocarpospora catenulata TaxID=2836182 RepID=UPI001BD9A48C|nr:M48 family metalloprotease [Acrocarpospora catenulata]